MSKKIELKNVVCRHNIPIRTGYGGATVHILVFFDPRDKETYWWKCTSGGYGFEEGVTYSLLAQYEGNQQISLGRIISCDRSIKDKSEQADAKPNALDILLPVMDLTYDDKYDIITKKGSEKYV